MTPIENLPEYASEYTYIVVTEFEEKYYFYGAFNDLDRARQVAYEVDGYVVAND